MFKVTETNRFSKDLRLCKRRSYKISDYEKVFKQLKDNGKINIDHKPHILSGDWQDTWECHIKGDWLLLYVYVEYEHDENDKEIYNTDFEIMLVRTGTHSDLF
ncbi:MAG: type II toxin-antitoxin system YafQ family toxin [Paludibacter sp.]